MLESAIACVKSGKVLIYPTETVYGIGGDASDETVIARVKQAKGRDADKPMLILTDEWARARIWIAEITPTHERLMHCQLPITILFKPTENVPRSLMGNASHIGIRRTTHPFCRELIAQSNCLLLSTSANPSGKMPVHDAKLLDDSLRQMADFVVDYGILPSQLPSTVVQIVGGEMKIIREGSITYEELIAITTQ